MLDISFCISCLIFLKKLENAKTKESFHNQSAILTSHLRGFEINKDLKSENAQLKTLEGLEKNKKQKRVWLKMKLKD